MIYIMLNLCETYQRMIITAFLHSYPDYTIKFVNSKGISTNCSKIERNLIWICDRDEDIGRLSEIYKERKCIPVIAFAHEANRGESLMGAPWLILSPDSLTPDLVEEACARSLDLPLVIARTSRCLIRELTFSDLPCLLQLQEENKKDPGGCFFPGECAAPDRFLRDYLRYQYSFYGFGLFAVLINHTAPACPAFAGIAGFSATGLADAQAEISYGFLKQYQHQGYAREAVEALLYEGKRRWQLEKIAARIRPGHQPSLRLARQFSIDIRFTNPTLL